MKTVKLRFVLNNKPDASGLFLIMLYIFKSGTKTPAYKGTGISVKQQHFNSDASRENQNWIRRSDLSQKYNLELTKIYDDAMGTISFLRDTGRLDHIDNKTIKQYIESGDPSDFLAYIQKRAEFLRRPETQSRAVQYLVAHTHLVTFLNNSPLPIGSLTVSLLNAFKSYLLTNTELAGSTIKNYFSALQSAYNAYHKENQITPKSDPFRYFSLDLDTSSKQKSILYPSHIQIILEKKNTLPILQLHAANAYLLLYFFQGIRIADLLKLQRKHIVKTTNLQTSETLYRVEYQMSKNKKPRNLPVPQVANDIIEFYLLNTIDPEQDKEDGYFLPFIYRYNTEADFRKNASAKFPLLNRISNLNRILNGNLKKACKTLGLPSSLTMHTSRHSFASHLYEKTKDIKAVQHAMAHSSISTTDRYLSDYIQSSKASDVYDEYKK